VQLGENYPAAYHFIVAWLALQYYALYKHKGIQRTSHHHSLSALRHYYYRSLVLVVDNTASIITMKALIIALAVAHAAATASAATCTFDIVVKTGERLGAGTDSRVTLQMSGASGRTLVIRSLKSWGQMDAGHDYFERGNLDRFRGTGKCFRGGPCKMLLSTDGKGERPGWYVSFVRVTQLGVGSVTSKTHTWTVDQWLAIDEAPFKLSALRNDCGSVAVALPHQPSLSGVEADPSSGEARTGA
jgi:hypothetical protein